jgi:lysophospholipase L1-like esterase
MTVRLRPVMLKFIVRFFLVLFILAGIAEIVLRVKYGFCTAPLYIADPAFEYIYAPNQELRRFGNRIATNSYSMRSDEVSASDSVVVLLVGDSVINGGSLTDHDSLASTKLEKRLSPTLGKKVRVLNIASGSWGPDNVAGYLNKYGLFNASLICVLTSSHDAHDIMWGQNPVGVDPSYPATQYNVALVELWHRYRYLILYITNEFFFPSQKEEPVTSTDTTKQAKPEGIRKTGQAFNPGYQQLLDISQKASVPLFIYLHPEISEVSERKFNDQGDEIMGFAKEKQVRLINELDLGITTDCYRDSDVIHYNDKGQALLARNLYPLFLEYLNKKK